MELLEALLKGIAAGLCAALAIAFGFGVVVGTLFAPRPGLPARSWPTSRAN